SDIVAVVGGYLPLRPAGATFKGLCPFHTDHRPSFDVDPRRQRFRCWSCEAVGDVFDFVMRFERVDFLEARAVLAPRAGVAPEGHAAPTPERVRLLEAVRWAAEQYRACLLDDALAEEARVYLGERKLSGDTVRKFGLGFAPLSGDWLLRRAEKAGVD